jgi:lipopolysaccharide heptosyltransferase II
VSADDRILVVGPSWVGDMVIAQSLYRLLRERDPATVMDVLAPAWSLPLLKRMPEVNRGIELPLGHGDLGLRKRRAIGRSLRGHYDRAIVLPRSLKSALVPWFARIPRRTGFRGESRYGLINDMRPFDPTVLDQTVRRFIALGLEPGERELPEPPEPRLRVDAAALSAAAERLGLDTAGTIVALMPGAEYGPAKQWPIESYAALARRLASAGAQIWVLGSAKETGLGAEIERLSGAAGGGSGAGIVRNLCGATSLVEACDLLGVATVAVSNDSGLMHIAAAVGTHVVAIYGSSTPDFTPPLTPHARIHYRRLACSPCFARECPLGHLDCLRGIAVETVAAGVEHDIAGAGARR